MQTAKLFMNGRSQAVRLPKEFQFKGDDVYIRKHGDAVILVPKDRAWETFLRGLDTFSEDFMPEGRSQGRSEERDAL